MVYVPEDAVRTDRRLVWVDRKGGFTPVADTQRLFFFPALSPDGRQVAVGIMSMRFGIDVWVYDAKSEIWSQLTFDGRSSRPFWTPDGRRVTFYSSLGGQWNTFWRLADGSGSAERLTSSKYPQFPTGWSPDGRTLIFSERNPETDEDIWILTVGGDARESPRLFLRTPFRETAARFSPDGRWVAYASNESGRDEVYVCSYPECQGRWRLSTGGGHDPHWAPGGEEVVYRHEDQVLSARFSAEGRFSAAEPRLLFRGQYDPALSHDSYDVAPDGLRFLMIRGEPQKEPVRLIAVLDWRDELRRRVP